MTTQTEEKAYLSTLVLKGHVTGARVARAEAEEAYNKAVEGAAKTRDAAKAKATATLQSAITKADSTYVAAVDAAEVGPEKAEAALVAAQEAFDTANASLLETYGGAVALDPSARGGRVDLT